MPARRLIDLRRALFALLVAATLMAHLFLASRGPRWLQAGAADAAMPARMQAVFVRELQPSTPPAAAAAPAPAPLTAEAAPVAAAAPTPPASSPRPRRAKAPASAPEPRSAKVDQASADPPAADAAALAAALPDAALPTAALPDASATALPDASTARELAASAQPELVATLDAASAAGEGSLAPGPSGAASASGVASATSITSAASAAVAVGSAGTTSASPSAAAASGPVFEWPTSTRLSYGLSGNVRGEVHGSAQVQWLREGSHYQVHLDVVIGPRFAPLMQRRMTSDGDIAASGLQPRRYDEETKIAFAPGRRLSLGFDARGVTLANGQRVPRLPGLQDSASQFVQLSFLFATQPQRLVRGARIVVPLALARRVDHWVYEVVGQETLHTPFGLLSAWHLAPQHAGNASVLSVEAWFAPSLQYLPVRLVVRQSADEYIDLLIERLPHQAAPAAR